MITFHNVTKRHGDAVAVDDLNLVTLTGKLTILVGPSGCAKTTSLRMVNRFIRPTSGDALLDGESTAHTVRLFLERRSTLLRQRRDRPG